MQPNTISKGYYRSWEAKSAANTEHSDESKRSVKEADAQASGAKAAAENKDTVAISVTDKETTSFSSGVPKSVFDTESSDSEDKSGDLTKRLISASGQFEVRQIISEATTALVKLRMRSGMSKGKDKELVDSYIKKFEKLIKRADQKIEGLDREDMVKLRQIRAEQKKQDKLAEEIKTELRKQKQLRKQKEENYLNEDMAEEMLGKSEGSVDTTVLDSAGEAEIAIQAEAMAAAEMAMTFDGGNSSAPVLDISVGVESGGESAPPELSIEA